jgi:hypothetical protein
MPAVSWRSLRDVLWLIASRGRATEVADLPRLP